MIDPKTLRIFLAICEEGSIGGAARRLGLAQPSVSVAVAHMERSLGAVLFERGHKGVALTDVGRVLRRSAEMHESLLRDAEEAVALSIKGIVGPLHIGGTPGALVSLVPSALARLEPGLPTAFHIVERSDGQLNDLLRRGEIEIATVTTGVEAPPPDIEETNIATDPFALVVGCAHPLIDRVTSLHDLASFKWVLPRVAGAFHRQIEALFLGAEAAAPADVIRCDSLLTSKEIVRRTDRITILPRGVVAAELAMGALRAIPIAGAEMNRRVGIRTLAGRRLSELGERFKAALLADHRPDAP